MKILITGGAGFIGSNLCEYFVDKNYDVTCLDNLSTGFKHNMESLIDKANFTFIEGVVMQESRGLYMQPVLQHTETAKSSLK